MILIGKPTDILQVTPHVHRTFSDLGQIGVLETIFVDGLLHLGIQQGVTTSALELGQHPSAVQCDPFGAFHLDQNVEDAKRKQPTLAPLDSSRYVSKAEQESNSLTRLPTC